MSSIPWRQIQKSSKRNLGEVCARLQINPELLHQSPSFPLLIPERLLNKMERGNLNDPLLRQFLPLREELETLPMFVEDPVGDTAARAAPRLLHKYHGRALLLVTSACAMHCRYCFRQHFDYVTEGGYDAELAYLAKDPSISEVILSGGDPLSLSDQTLEELLRDLSGIPHIQRIRFHSRFPVGIPERINDSFLKLLDNIRPQVWFVVHINHPRELDKEIISALQKIARLGIPLLSQSVLLKGVNDDLEVLTDLCEQLADAGILPYYLHQLDRVAGATHFEVSEEEGLTLVDALTSRLSGYAVPRYVREIQGKPSKTPVTST